MKKIILLPVFVIGLFAASCKKDIYGCTDPNAQNYSTKATTDDGSCIAEAQQQVFEETFSMYFGPSTYYNIYSPSFDYSPGDLIVLEHLNDPTFNYYTAMPVVTQNIVVWGEYGYNTGEIWIYAHQISTGNPFFFPTQSEFGFRALLVKKKAIDLNPEIKEMSIDQIKLFVE
jgi:hypothetical protein